MKSIMISLFAFSLFVLGLTALQYTFSAQVGAETVVQADIERTISLDVACDCRTFAFNSGATFAQGDGFIVNGKVFPAGTLPEGTASNDPNDPGSIGDWICRGTLTGAEEPIAFVTQHHLLADGSGLVSEGTAGEMGGRAALVGGIGSFSGSAGDVTAQTIGTNITDCPNIRFTFKLKKQAPK